MTAGEYTATLGEIRKEVTDARPLRDPHEQVMALEQIAALALMAANDLKEGVS